MTEGKCIEAYILSMKQNNFFLQTDSAVFLPKWSQIYFQIFNRMYAGKLSITELKFS